MPKKTKNKPLVPNPVHFSPGQGRREERPPQRLLHWDQIRPTPVERCLAHSPQESGDPVVSWEQWGHAKKQNQKGECTNIYLQKSKVHMIQALYIVVKTGLFYVFTTRK